MKTFIWLDLEGGNWVALIITLLIVGILVFLLSRKFIDKRTSTNVLFLLKLMFFAFLGLIILAIIIGVTETSGR